MTKRVQIAEMTVGNLRAVLHQIQPEMRYELTSYWDGKQMFRVGPADYATCTTAMNSLLSGSLQKLTCAEVHSTRRSKIEVRAA